VRNTTVVNSHVAYSGGPGGINHPPTAQENQYSHEQHTAPTPMQTQHEGAARTNVNNYASHNGGRPATVATERPMEGGPHGPASGGNNHNSPNPNTGNRNAEPENRGGTNPQYEPGNHGSGNQGGGTESKTYNASHSNTANRTYNSSHSNTGNQPAPHPQPQPHKNPPPQSHNPPAPHGGGGGGNQGHEHGH